VKRFAVPRDMTHALPSLLSEPSVASEIRFVSGPPLFAMTVTCRGALILIPGRFRPDGFDSGSL
jgi:hypothetical protein